MIDFSFPIPECCLRLEYELEQEEKYRAKEYECALESRHEYTGDGWDLELPTFILLRQAHL